VVGKLTQVIQYYAWYDLCQCQTTATPAPTVSVEPPTAVQPNQTSGPPPPDACIDLERGVNGFDSPYLRTFGPTDKRPIGDLVPQFFGSATTTTAVMTDWDGAPTVTALKIPTPHPIALHGVISNVVNTPSNFAQTLCVSVLNAAGVITTDTFVLQGWNGNVVTQPSVPYVFTATDDRLVLFNIIGAQELGGGYNAHVTMDCSGPSVSAPCCPPDDYSQTILVNILNKVSNISTSGSSAPTSWRDSTRHTALTGSGRLVFTAGTVGVRVEVTTITAGIDVHPGNPAFYFDMGFITPIAIDVPLRGQRLVFNPQSFAMPQFADGISWTLPAGAVINLIELQPVP
jgi:hypothetical protein